MLPIFLATYGAVFVAEIVGDKLLYTTGVLATRYRTAPIFFGMALAFMAKMGVAVLVGKADLQAAAAAGSGHHHHQLLRHRVRPVAQAGHARRPKKEYPASRAVMVSFAAIFFSEWGDVGQITAATMAAQVRLRRCWSGSARSAPWSPRARWRPRSAPASANGSRTPFARRRSATRRWACCCFSGCSPWSRP